MNFGWEETEIPTWGVLFKKVFLEIWPKFTGKHLCQSLLFNKVGGLRPDSGDSATGAFL